MEGTKINRMFEGMWVNTMVRIRPNLEATQAAERAESPARILAPKKMLPRSARQDVKTDVKPVSHDALQDKPAGEGIQGEEG